MPVLIAMTDDFVNWPDFENWSDFAITESEQVQDDLISSLPLEILLHILEYLDPTDFVQCRKVRIDWPLVDS